MNRLLLALLLCVTCHAQDAWTKGDTAREAACVAVSMADWGQTLDIHDRYEKGAPCYEQNPLLGLHPSRATINKYFASSIVLHAVISRLLPEQWRHAFQYISIGFEYGVVSRNAQLGFRVSF